MVSKYNSPEIESGFRYTQEVFTNLCLHFPGFRLIKRRGEGRAGNGKKKKARGGMGGRRERETRTQCS
jgi:hypothetical protein